MRLLLISVALATLAAPEVLASALQTGGAHSVVVGVRPPPHRCKVLTHPSAQRQCPPQQHRNKP